MIGQPGPEALYALDADISQVKGDDRLGLPVRGPTHLSKAPRRAQGGPGGWPGERLRAKVFSKWRGRDKK